MPAVSVRLFKPSPPWLKDARVKCRGLDPELFYPNSPSASVTRAKAVCTGADGGGPCYFLQTCLEYALEEHEQFGVWGGTSERERRRIWRQRKTTTITETHTFTTQETRGMTITTVQITRHG